MHVTARSQDVKPGSIFFALQGAKFDGHLFIEDAFRAGAEKVYCERELDPKLMSKLGADASRVEVLGKNARRRLGELASEMCGFPTRTLKMIGVTGTSGKTTTTYLIQHLLTTAGFRCARLGTNGGQFEGKTWETHNTTPDAITLQKWFKEVLELGATHVAMEVSSHSLHQDRVWGIAWDACVFLNLSSEHLDYHSNLDDYFSAKKILFTDHSDFSTHEGKSPVLLSNEDSKFGKRLVENQTRIETFSAQRHIATLTDTETGLKGTLELWGKKFTLECPLFGNFQKDNILAAVEVAVSIAARSGPGAFGNHHHRSDLSSLTQEMLNGLKTFTGVPGRMEFIPNPRGIFVFVDYAHKPEALEKVLLSIQGKKIITVFGCGGDRDKTKRPMMGKIAATLSAQVILTSDNPRTEDPQQILKEIEAGVKEASFENYEVIADRREAIRHAMKIASKGDVVLIAGKGHEDYQIFGTEKKHFDDREEARAALLN